MRIRDSVSNSTPSIITSFEVQDFQHAVEVHQIKYSFKGLQSDKKRPSKIAWPLRNLEIYWLSQFLNRNKNPLR